LIEVTAGTQGTQQGTQSQDGFGSGQAPAGTGDIHAIFDQVPTGPFDHAGGNNCIRW
jgi:hypothetical protein